MSDFPTVPEAISAPGARPLVVTGAGISVASGIPTFRGKDPGAVWSRDVLEMGTYRFFRRDPIAQWQWYLSRFDSVRGARPNAAHHALVSMEATVAAGGGKLALITQNIDGLHYAAGHRRVFEVHGTAHRIRCANDGCAFAAPCGSYPWDDEMFASFRAHPAPDTLPRCTECHDLLRAHVLWFDEYYQSHEGYAFDDAMDAARDATAMIFVGTSFSVGITAILTDIAREKALPVWVIDPNQDGTPEIGEAIRAPSEVVLPAWAAELARRAP